MGDDNVVVPNPDNANAEDVAQAPAEEAGAGGQGQNQNNKRWKLKNANMRIIDVCTQTKPGGRDCLVIKMEFKFTNRAKEYMTKVVGRFNKIKELV